jgi:hypothetical protein
MEEIDKLLERIKSNTLSGSAELTNQLIDGLLLLEPFLTQQDKMLSTKKIGSMAANKPFFAVLTHFAQALENSGNRWLPFLYDYKQQFSALHERIAEQLLQEIKPDHKTFLLHSNSSTLISVFQSLAKRLDVIKIFQTLSTPGDEGLEQAEKLRKLSIDVQMVDTEPSPEILSAVDCFLTGADLILPDTFINKVGTKPIAEKIRHHNKLYFVLADPRKFTSQIPSSLPAAFEYIPRRLVTKFITGVV